MRGRRSDIDPDRRQLDIVGGPGDLVDRDIVGTDVKVIEFEIVHRRQHPDSEVRKFSRHPLMRTSESKGHWQTRILARFLDLKFPSELAATMVGTLNPPH